MCGADYLKFDSVRDDNWTTHYVEISGYKVIHINTVVLGSILRLTG